MTRKLTLLTLTMSFAALAQNAPRMYRLYSYDVPADSAADFFDVQRDTAGVYKANKGPFPRLCWTSLTGSQKFHMLVPIDGLDQLMENTWLSKQGEERERSARQDRLRRASGGLEIRLIARNADLTIDDTPNGAPDAFLTLNIDSVRPGRVQEYLAALKDVAAANRQIGKAKSFYVHRVNYGGNSYEFHVVIGYASLADIPSVADFQKAMGEKYTAYTRKMGEVLDGRERQILRYRPEFSYMPEAK